MRSFIKNLSVTLGLLAAATVLGYVLGKVFVEANNAHLMYLLAVLLISRFTDGYFWGILSSAVSVPLVNYMFTYPYYAFNLTIAGYLPTFITMLTVSLIVSVLTTRIKQQEQLKLEAEKEKLRADLLRAVSHDLRTPLTSIVGATGAILDNAIAPEKQHELLQDVNSDAQWLLRMIENLLAITRIQDKPTPLRMATEVVEDILAESVMKFHKHFPEVQVDVEPSEDILLADMDGVLIEQVLLNLLENAVYHGKHTTRIRLCAQRKDCFVQISVIDNGAGIPKDKLPQLFAVSLASDRQRSSDAQKHMGIGLSVCKTIVKAHGGTMRAHNNPQGGACVCFTLPGKENIYGCKSPDCRG